MRMVERFVGVELHQQTPEAPSQLILICMSRPRLGSCVPEGLARKCRLIFLSVVFTFGVAMLVGGGLGLAMGLQKTIEQSMLSMIPLFLTIPTLLMVFLAVIWFGFSEVGSLIAAMAVVTPFVTVHMWQGTKAMDKSLIDMAKAFKAHRGMVVRKVLIPQLMPYIFSAFRYAFGMTWKIVALAETFGLKFGIGYMFFSGSSSLVWTRCWRGLSSSSS